MHLSCGDLALADGLVYLLSQLFDLLFGQLLGTFPVVLVEVSAVTAAAAAPAVILTFLLLLKGIEDLFDAHVVEARVVEAHLLTI